jgi:phosphoribosylanthranilate isomerase
MGLEIKICGVTAPETVEAAIAGGADWLGFVFFPKSPRNLSLMDAAELGARVRGRAGKVALCVDAPDSVIAAIVEALRPDLLQLHGQETPARTAEIRARFGVPVMKAIGVAGKADLIRARDYIGAADRLLFDAKPPRDAALPGGNGVVFDWSLLADLDLPVPTMLSGGLDPTNVAAAIAIANPDGVDVSSGVERAPGEKDPALVAAFIAAARGATRPRVSPPSPAASMKDMPA